ncbi:MAG: 4-hydroxy-2-oxovalerate aldolase [Candidatus Omnitrophica bacterium]|nr:4-hydroxy-2-oxovalerate aldolase [Candidatus Omnitrophota bacterium]
MVQGNHSLKRKLRAREPVLGAWTSLAHPSITEIFAACGVDFVGIDMEHSTITLEQAQQVMAASQAGQAACLPRVSSHNGEQIRRLLDSGADGIIVPNVSSAKEAIPLIEWCKYPPVGKRSYGIARAQGYGFQFEEYTRTWNERSVLLLQIESEQGAGRINELLQFDAVDGVMIGPYDMSGSLGIPGQLDHPLILEACRGVIDAARRHRKACGTQVVDPTEENVAAAFEAGYTFVVLASDIFILWKWSQRMRTLTENLKAGLQPKT